jgi:hypothetical protein
MVAVGRSSRELGIQGANGGETGEVVVIQNAVSTETRLVLLLGERENIY